MVRTKRWRLLILMMAVLGMCLSPSGHAQATLAPDLVISEVRISNVRDNTFTVSWITDQVATGEVRYGTSPGSLTQIAYDVRGVSATDDTHYVAVLGLTPSTLYYFDVASSGTVNNNGGAHFTVTTGPVLGLPASDTIYGLVYKQDWTTLSAGSLVYITLFDNNGTGSSGQAAELSSLVDSSGFWFTNLGSARRANLAGYFIYSSSGDGVELTTQGGSDGTVRRTIGTDYDSPAPNLVQGAGRFDFVAPAGVGVEDIQAEATCWHQPQSASCPASYDTDGDGDFDMVDIMRVAASWGCVTP